MLPNSLAIIAWALGTKLKLLDSNKDGLINSQDSQFNDLRIWQDKTKTASAKKMN